MSDLDKEIMDKKNEALQEVLKHLDNRGNYISNIICETASHKTEYLNKRYEELVRSREVLEILKSELKYFKPYSSRIGGIYYLRFPNEDLGDIRIGSRRKDSSFFYRWEVQVDKVDYEEVFENTRTLNLLTIKGTQKIESISVLSVSPDRLDRLVSEFKRNAEEGKISTKG